jgi:hypothetical protein
MGKKKTNNQPIDVTTLPLLPSVDDIQSKLSTIFPESFPDRSILVSNMAARVIFVFLYGGFIEGTHRFLRPSHVYLFTKDQEGKVAVDDRARWLAVCNKPGYRMSGEPWYADTSKETIRDDLMRNQLLRLGIMHKLPGYATTASTPINYLSADFAAMFDPALKGEPFEAVVGSWRVRHLGQATQQRMALKAQGLQAKEGDLLIDMPDGTRIRISAGPSSQIAKALIEEFATRHLVNPAVLWLSASDKKAFPQFVEISESVGLKIDVGTTLPDLILADMREPIKFLFCEIVATDGAITDARKQEFLAIVRESRVPENAVEFLTAFEDRSVRPFKNNFSKLAVNSLIWFRTEPDLLVILSTAGRADLDPNNHS